MSQLRIFAVIKKESLSDVVAMTLQWLWKNGKQIYSI